MQLSINSQPSIAKKYGITSIWFGERSGIRPTDPTTQARLNVHRPTGEHTAERYILIMRFEKVEGLKSYYSDSRHEQLRRRLYQFFEPQLSILYDLLTPGQGLPDNAVKFYGQLIEAEAAKHLRRYDYESSEGIKEMLEITTPF